MQHPSQVSTLLSSTAQKTTVRKSVKGSKNHTKVSDFQQSKLGHGKKAEETLKVHFLT